MGLEWYAHLHLRFSTFTFWRYVTLCSYLVLCEMFYVSFFMRCYQDSAFWKQQTSKSILYMKLILRKLQSTNAAGLISFASGNQLTINTTIWAEFSRMFTKKCKTCSVFFLLILKTAWSTKPKRQHEYHYPISVFYFFIISAGLKNFRTIRECSALHSSTLFEGVRCFLTVSNPNVFQNCIEHSEPFSHQYN